MAKQIYGLVGYPLKHSFSKKYFTEKFVQENIDAQYLNFEIENIDLFSNIIESYTDNLCGLNVTIPYKEQVIPFLTRLDANAREIGAVNVIKIIRNNTDRKIELVGYNSDMLGFENSILPLIEKDIHKKALVLGTGGASKAIVQAMKTMGIEHRYVSRTKTNDNYTYSELDKSIIDEYQVIVNTSPVGTFPDEDNAPAIPYHLLTNKHLLYDLVYNPAETKFLKLGRTQGANIKNGAEMLKLQADASWHIWNNPDL